MIFHLGYPKKGTIYWHMSFIRENYSLNIYLPITNDVILITMLDPWKTIMKKVRPKDLWSHAAYNLMGEFYGRK